MGHPAKESPSTEQEHAEPQSVGGPDAAPSPESVWPKVLELAGPRLRAMLDSMVVQQASPKLLKLGVPASRAAMARDHIPEVIRLVQQTGARSMSIQFVDLKPKAEHQDSQSPSHQSSEQSTAGDTQDQPPPQEHGSNEPNGPAADDHPLVQEAARVFGAKVTHIHPKRR